ncbi:MAG: GTPase Der [Thermotoga sp. 50_1627]|uniref:ribosome biogenesis GTPase Der n=1 Tax=Pseudothermotoga sp. TaxID=2033661 RepID=UPI00076D248A|nr:MAG: GTPase Der [Thermotoga sp. 50_1627]MBC7117279.1 ribosome biogenesis GTPase Der [Pseudothermotoga sp.]MDK2923261.1 GTPase [Pseudothermotoga sp.]HBT39226.1 ribosome biogenesis GTPase Der [Pseudothermotoga sp.]
MAKVVIAGKTNVGKSTLFNRLIRRRKAITEKEEGVTRDTLKGIVVYGDAAFTLFDTCGVYEKADDEMLQSMKQRALKAFEEADLILFVVNAREGITSEDEYIAQMLRKLKKRVILVINKAENMKIVEENLPDIFRLGFDDYVLVSAQHNLNVDQLLEKIVNTLKEMNVPLDQPEPDRDYPSIAIIGKPNVGKSSLFNAILNEDRVNVTPIPGTTRDPVDELVEIDGKKYVFIDTAGLRRKSRIEEKSLEYFSVKRAIDAMESADVVVLLIDAMEGVSRQDKRIARLALDRGKALVIDVNKFDLIYVKKSDYERAVRAEMPFVDFCRIVFTSAVKRQGLKSLLSAIDEAYASYCRRIEQSRLNKLLLQLPILAPSLSDTKVYAIRQMKIKPPKFVFTVNRKERIGPQVQSMLQRLIRERVDPFTGSPIFLEFKPRG